MQEDRDKKGHEQTIHSQSIAAESSRAANLMEIVVYNGCKSEHCIIFCSYSGWNMSQTPDAASQSIVKGIAGTLAHARTGAHLFARSPNDGTVTSKWLNISHNQPTRSVQIKCEHISTVPKVLLNNGRHNFFYVAREICVCVSIEYCASWLQTDR